MGRPAAAPRITFQRVLGCRRLTDPDPTLDRRCAVDGNGSSRCAGAGQSYNDTGVTGLALLALLGAGNTTRTGEHAEAVHRAVEWLRARQEKRSGLISDQPQHAHMLYGHAIATLALVEASRGVHDPLLQTEVQAAVGCILRARNADLAWRYSLQPDGENDTSVTGWMVTALAASENAGYRVGREAFDGALNWIDRVTEETTGRVGYDSVGSLSARTTTNENSPREGAEGMTAVGLWCRFLCGQDPSDAPIMQKNARLIAQNPPLWQPELRLVLRHLRNPGRIGVCPADVLPPTTTRSRAWTRACERASRAPDAVPRPAGIGRRTPRSAWGCPWAGRSRATRSSASWARAAWARSTARATRAWSARSRSRCSPKPWSGTRSTWPGSGARRRSSRR
jgi:hypothetical protein